MRITTNEHNETTLELKKGQGIFIALALIVLLLLITFGAVYLYERGKSTVIEPETTEDGTYDVSTLSNHDMLSTADGLFDKSDAYFETVSNGTVYYTESTADYDSEGNSNVTASVYYAGQLFFDGSSENYAYDYSGTTDASTAESKSFNDVFDATLFNTDVDNMSEFVTNVLTNGGFNLDTLRSMEWDDSVYADYGQFTYTADGNTVASDLIEKIVSEQGIPSGYASAVSVTFKQAGLSNYDTVDLTSDDVDAVLSGVSINITWSDSDGNAHIYTRTYGFDTDIVTTGVSE